MPSAADKQISLHVSPLAGGGTALGMHPLDMKASGIGEGALVAVQGVAIALARVKSLVGNYSPGGVRMSRLLCASAGADPGDQVSVAPTVAQTAKGVTLLSMTRPNAMEQMDRNSSGFWKKLFHRTGPADKAERRHLDLRGQAVMKGNFVSGDGYSESRWLRVIETVPDGPVVIDAKTSISVLNAEEHSDAYAEVGGLADEVARVREMVELPLRHPEVFGQLGIDPPRGLLLYVPPGSGKTLLAQAVAGGTEVNFIVVNGRELVSRWVGESERGIREVFRRARQSAPSILFFDQMDAVVPARGAGDNNGGSGNRIVGQLLLEIDSAPSGVVVLAATNRPDLIDQALLRPGRFDLVIELPLPDREARLEILKIHTRPAQLATDVDFAGLAGGTAGLTGADLAALCQRAKMLAIAESVSRYPGPTFPAFTVDNRHFRTALFETRQQTGVPAPLSCFVDCSTTEQETTAG